jgi:hypothetical protein
MTFLFPRIGGYEYFLGQAASDDKTAAIDCQGDLALVDIGDDFQFISDPKAHRHQPDFGARSAGKFPDHQPLTGFGQDQGDQIAALLPANGTETVEFGLVLQGKKSIPSGDFRLKAFQLRILEFDDRPAFGTDQMIVMLADMFVFIPDIPILKPIFLGESEMTQQPKRVLHKVQRQIGSLGMKNVVKFSGSDVMLGVQKGFQHLETILESVDAFLVKEFSELIFFLAMEMFHGLGCPISTGGLGSTGSAADFNAVRVSYTWYRSRWNNSGSDRKLAGARLLHRS